MGVNINTFRKPRSYSGLGRDVSVKDRIPFDASKSTSITQSIAEHLYSFGSGCHEKARETEDGWEITLPEGTLRLLFGAKQVVLAQPLGTVGAGITIQYYKTSVYPQGRVVLFLNSLGKQVLIVDSHGRKIN